MIDTKRIVKNTAYLYVRLLLVFGVTLYTSRVVLDKLGVDDFGLYNVIFSIIGLLSFFNGTLSIGTSRFLTFNLGTNDTNRIQATFQTALTCHLFLSLAIFIVGETIGLLYLHNVMVCPDNRLFAADITYQVSILVTILAIVQVPFSSEIIAHEKMEFYAYIGIFEAVATLGVAFLISISNYDKLILYSILIFLTKLCVFIIFLYYSHKSFIEVRLKFGYNKQILQSLLSFSGWNIIANISSMLMNQGVIMLFNLFFAPFVVAAQAISNQISQAVLLLVNNVRQAINPQVIKLYADGKYDESKKLTLDSAEYVFDLLLLLGVPLILTMPQILDIWLVDVPEYAVIFAQFTVFQNILDNFNAAFYTPMLAANKIKKNSLFAAILCISQFVLLWVIFMVGCDAIWSRYIGIVFCCIWSFLIKPYILWKDINYNLKELGFCIFRCMRVLIAVTISSLIIFKYFPQHDIFDAIKVCMLVAIVILLWSIICLKKEVRHKLVKFVLNKI